MADATATPSDSNVGDFFPIAIDLIEGVIAGGLIGLVMFLIAAAVSLFPNSFVTPALVVPLSTIAGVLAFAGVALFKIKARFNI